MLATSFVLALACGVNVAPAQTATAVGAGIANSQSQSGAVAVSGGSSSSVTFNTPGVTRSNSNIRYKQSGSLKTTSNAIAPGLAAAGIESCNSSFSGAVGATGWGLSFGGPIMDNECNLRLWARTLYAMGQKELVGAVMAQSPTITKAMQIIDQQRGTPVAYNGGVAPAGYGAPGTRSRAGLYSNCSKWSGGATGVGRCVY